MARTAALAGLSALLLIGAAGAAHAETAARPAAAFTGTSESPWALNAPRKTLQWDSKGRWGLRLDMEKPVGRDMNLSDVQAGAFIKITPSLRVGGTVGVGSGYAPQQKLLPQTQDPGARVHLETKLQF